jgi:hypothetical protein
MQKAKDSGRAPFHSPGQITVKFDGVRKTYEMSVHTWYEKRTASTRTPLGKRKICTRSIARIKLRSPQKVAQKFSSGTKKQALEAEQMLDVEGILSDPWYWLQT